jgi:DNA-binding CsgD family transcriptional regulator/PAS domain-containing protein
MLLLRTEQRRDFSNGNERELSLTRDWPNAFEMEPSIREMNPEILSLIEMFYRATIEPDLWRVGLARASSYLQSEHGYVWVSKAAAPTTPVLAVSGLSDADVERFFSDEAFRLLMPYLMPYLSSLPPGTAMDQTQVWPDDQLERSAFYNEIVRPSKTFYVNAVWHEGADMSVRVSICRVRSKGHYSNNERRAIEIMFAHLRRAVVLHDRLRIGEEYAIRLTAVIERLAEATIVLDATGRIVIANARALAILNERDGLVLVSDQLRATHPALDVKLQEACASAATSILSQGQRLRIPRRLRLPLLVDVMPVWKLGLGEPGLREPRSVVFIKETDAPPRIDQPALIETFRLTPRESEIVCLLAEGMAVDQIAVRLQIQAATVRQNLKSAYEKTSVHSQAALVALARNFGR